MNKIIYDQKLSCMLFGCPMVEELKSCSISNLRLLTTKQPFIVEERLEKFVSDIIISAKFICITKK